MSLTDFRYSKRVERELDKVYKHLCDREKPGEDQRKYNIRQIFALRHRAYPEAAPTLVNGLEVVDMIKDDIYEISYVGNAKDFLPLGKTPKTKAQREFRTAWASLTSEQTEAIREGTIRRKEALGETIFEEDEPEELEDTASEASDKKGK